MNGFAKMRRKAGFTQEQFAAELSVDRSTVAKWETGAAVPGGIRLMAIARICNCTVDDLLAEDETSEKTA